MNSATLELALKKQRLQIASESLRDEFGRYAKGLGPAFRVADGAIEGARWVRHNPQIAIAATAALIVIRPTGVWRWMRRAYVGWRAWRNVREFLERRQSAVPSNSLH